MRKRYQNLPVEYVTAADWERLPPDTILPVQFFGAFSPSELAPENRMKLDILESGLRDYQKGLLGDTEASAKLFSEARGWIASDNRTYPLSFLNVCEALGIVPEYARSKLRTWRANIMARRSREAA